MISLYKDPKGVKVFDKHVVTSSSASTNMSTVSSSKKQPAKGLAVPATTMDTVDTTVKS